jgi:hypothetical protein
MEKAEKRCRSGNHRYTHGISSIMEAEKLFKQSMRKKLVFCAKNQLSVWSKTIKASKTDKIWHPS